MVAEAKWQEYFLFLIVSPMRRDYLLEWEFLATGWLTLSEISYINLFPSDSDITKLNCFNGTCKKQNRKADTEVCSTQGKCSELLGATAAISVNQISLPFFVFLTF
jgi:hypothetical protein